MSVTDAGPVKSHLLLQDNTSPSSELPEKSTAPSISEESQNGILLQVAQFPEGAQQSTLSSNIAEGQHKSQNTPLQITNSSEQSAVKSSSTSREMVEGKHVTFRKQPSHLPKYQALLLSATETTKTQHVARGPIKCQTLPRKATVEPPQKENKEGSHLTRRNTMPTNTSRPTACPYNNIPKPTPMIGVPPRESPSYLIRSEERRK
ncbi:hypothetical protein GBAR_LOCUS2641 [Geodia barretti]|uniref:Uncharacterized protein n=1 Tax=Geodia barretti TaxID=519541 RepID=A0AA35R1I2_GEOBA|nr:hypothetical protein GBAR_LOCUS2641 [Geodia barretti]